MTVVLALVAALAYGLSDFTGGVFSQRTSPWAVAFVASLTGIACVLGLTHVVGGSPTGTDYLWSLVAGLGNGFGTAFLYRGLSSGRMAVVAPVSGVGAALLPVAVGVFTGERPSSLVWVGIAAALPAIWLVSRTPDHLSANEDVARGGGLVDGVIAGLGFGTLFAALAQIPEEAGFLPLALNQVVATVMIAVVATALRSSWVPRDRQALAGLVCGVLGAGATVCFLVASQGGFLTVTAVLASLYPGFTVVLAALVLREHIHRTQALGLALCAAAVALVAAG